MAEAQGDWRSEAFRRKVITQIDEAVRSSNTPMAKSSVEMENHVYHKAKSREEYLALVARLILHVKDFNNQRRERQMQQAALAGGAIPGQMPSGSGGLPTQGPPGMQDPINALQNMAGMGQSQPGMMAGQQMQSIQQQRQQMLLQQQQQQQRMAAAAGQQQAVRPPQLQRQDAFIVTQAQPVQQVAPAQVSAPQTATMTFSTSNLVRQAQLSGMTSLISQQASPQVNSNPPSQGAVPSPAQPSSQLAGSPMPMMPSPSPQIVPSPGPKIVSMGAPSPSTALNTPGNPGSVGAAPSPASQSAEEKAYLEKLQQLSKYIEPLRRMIKKTEDGKDSDHRKTDINKLHNLHDILTNPSKRVPMPTLAKCEQVLEKIQFGPKSSSSTPAAASAPAPHVHMCQPLLDSVAAHITSPVFNHVLQKTFGPAMTALYGNPIKAPSPPRKRRKVEDGSKSHLPDMLQGEIVRLDRRFKVKLDPLQHPASKDVHLVCKLDDYHLPNVPPILVTIPSDYPENSPECSMSRKDYDASPFLQSIQKALITHLVSQPSKYSFTSLLDMWEMSVRKACMMAS